MSLLSLNRFILIPILSEWTALIDYGMFDSSLTSTSLRPKVLDLIQQYSNRFEAYIIENELDLPFSKESINWLVNRNMNISVWLKRVEISTHTASILAMEPEEHRWPIFLYLEYVRSIRIHKMEQSMKLDVISSCRNLEELYVEYSPSSNDIIDIICQYCTSLTKLVLPSGTLSSKESLQKLCHFCPDLIDFTPNNSISPSTMCLQGFKAIPSSVSNKMLTMMCMHNRRPLTSFSRQRLTKSQLQLLLEYNDCTHLTELNLSQGLLSDANMLQIASHCPNLRDLNLMFCSSLTVDGLIPLLTSTKQLTRLNITCFALLTDEALHVIGQLKLKCFLATNIQAPNYSTLNNLLPLCNSLYQLGIVNTDNKSLISLIKGCSRLKDLIVSENYYANITENDTLCAFLPSCEYLLKLAIRNCKYVSNPTILAVAKHCLLLRELYYDTGNMQYDISTGIVAILTNCKQLRILECGLSIVIYIAVRYSNDEYKFTVLNNEEYTDKSYKSVSKTDLLHINKYSDKKKKFIHAIGAFCGFNRNYSYIFDQVMYPHQN